MMPLREYKRGAVVPLAGLALAGYYLLVFLPLVHRADAIEDRLMQDWKKLTTALDQTNAVALDFRRINNQIQDNAGRSLDWQVRRFPHGVIGGTQRQLSEGGEIGQDLGIPSPMLQPHGDHMSAIGCNAGLPGLPRVHLGTVFSREPIPDQSAYG